MSYDFRLPEFPAIGRRRSWRAVPTARRSSAAAFSGERRALGDRELGRAFFAHPLLTLKVILAIHWQALRLLGQACLHPKPAPPGRAVTVVRTEVDQAVAELAA